MFGRAGAIAGAAAALSVAWLQVAHERKALYQGRSARAVHRRFALARHVLF